VPLQGELVEQRALTRPPLAHHRWRSRFLHLSESASPRVGNRRFSTE
jgi:hypothetical protein